MLPFRPVIVPVCHIPKGVPVSSQHWMGDAGNMVVLDYLDTCPLQINEVCGATYFQQDVLGLTRVER